MKLVCCPRCSHLMIYRGHGKIAKCSRCMKDMRLEKGEGVIPVVNTNDPRNHAGKAIPVVDLWGGTPRLMLEVWSSDGTHCRVIEVPIPDIDPDDLIVGLETSPSGRYPVPEAVLDRLHEALAGDGP